MSYLDDAIKLSGGLSAFAVLMGESPQVINNWRARGVPVHRCPKVESIVGGRVTCEQLRPDVDWACRRYVPAGEQDKEAA